MIPSAAFSIRWAFAFLFLIALCVGLEILEGCASLSSPPPAPPLPAYCYSEPALIAAHVSCSAKASTRAESEACGIALDRSCGFDGGSP